MSDEFESKGFTHYSSLMTHHYSLAECEQGAGRMANCKASRVESTVYGLFLNGAALASQ
jgi:hypothetical protein